MIPNAFFTPSRFCLLALLGALSAGDATAKQFFRWVDEEGNVHYSDTVPPEHSKRRREALNENARTIKVIEAAKTPEQIAREKELRRLREERERLKAEERQKDQILLKSFSSVEQLASMEKDKLAILENRKHIFEANLARSKEKLAALQEEAANLERKGYPVKPKMFDSIAAEQQRIERLQEKIRQIDAKRHSLERRFAEDKRRLERLLSPRPDPMREKIDE